MQQKIIALTLLLSALFTLQPFAQNIGIGTATPTRARLELHGGVGRTAGIFGGEGIGISLQKDYPAVGFNQYFDGVNARYIGNGYAMAQWFSPFTGTLNFDAYPSGTANNTGNPVRVLTLDRFGHVGLGTGATNGYLQFYNDEYNRKIVLFETANNDHQFYGMGINSSTLRYQVANTSSSHTFYAAQSGGASLMLMRVAGNKKVFIGEQAAGFRLGINSFDPQYTIEMVQTNNKGIFLVNPVIGYTNWEIAAAKYSENDVCLILYHNQSVAPSGWFRPDNGNYFANSDRRLKENIQQMDAVLPRVMQLRPTHYNFKADAQKHKQSGFIAQELEQLFPTLVSTVPGREKGDPSTSGIDYGGLSVIAIKAIQELQAEVVALRKEIDQLKKSK